MQKFPQLCCSSFENNTSIYSGTFAKICFVILYERPVCYSIGLPVGEGQGVG